MIPEGLDKTISTGLAIGSAALAFWAHRRDLAKEKHRSAIEKMQAEEEAQRKYAAHELKKYAAERDFGHIKRDLEQLKSNTDYLRQEGDERLDQLERGVEKLTGANERLNQLERQVEKLTGAIEAFKELYRDRTGSQRD